MNLRNERRNIVHFNVVQYPTAHWTARQLPESYGFEEKSKYLMQDCDAIYGNAFRQQANNPGIQEVVTAG